CVINSANFPPTSPHPVSELGQLKVAGTAAVGPVSEAITVTEFGIPVSATGNNYLPDLHYQWNEAEFNVVGPGGGSETNFNSGAKLVVRTEVTSETKERPGCHLQSFTAERNNLTLDNSPPVSPARRPTAALVFSESNPAAAGPAADCKSAVSLD